MRQLQLFSERTEALCLVKALPQNSQWKGFSPVCVPMCPNQAGVLDEAFPACAASLWLLAGVDPRMYL